MTLALAKPQLYDLIRELHAEHKLPAADIAELVGKSRTYVYRIIDDLGLKPASAAAKIKALPASIVARCILARHR